MGGNSVVGYQNPVHVDAPRTVPDAVMELSGIELVKRHWNALIAMRQYAVGDALAFDCQDIAVLAREREMRSDEARVALMTKIAQAAGAKLTYQQDTLRIAPGLVAKAQAGICTVTGQPWHLHPGC